MVATNYSLRDYQTTLVQQVFSSWGAGNRRVMLQLATGGGKSVLFAAIAREFTAKNERVLVIAHREELLLQAQDKLQQIAGLPVGLIKAGYPENPTSLIQVASIQTLMRRTCKPEAALVIFDEAHHCAAASYQNLFKYYESAYVLGVTATPTRIDGRGFKDLFESLVTGKSTAELIEDGYLCRFKLFATKNPIKTTGVSTTAGDFNLQQLAACVKTNVIMADLISTWKKYASNKRTIIFAINIEHSQQIAEGYIASGISAAHLDGETPTSERRAILEKFRSGEILVITNCGLFTEGLDIPNIEAVQCARPTKSLVLWLQMLGRALRPVPGKEYAVLIDHTENWLHHGLPDENRHWSLEPISRDSRAFSLECYSCNHVFVPLPEEKKRAIAFCPNCSALIHLNKPKKKDEQDEETKVVTRSITENKDVELQELQITKESRLIAEIERLKEIQQRNSYKPMWVYYQLLEKFRTLDMNELVQCAKIMGFKHGWAAHKFRELQERKTVVLKKKG